MVKSNFSLGGKLLTIFLTLVIFIGAIAGTLVVVYKTVKVRTLAGLLGNQDWISESYDGTIEDFAKKVSEALSGEITLNTLIEISPAIEEKLDGVVDNIENIGLFVIDKDVLYSTGFSQISSSIMDILVLTGTLNDLAEYVGFSLPDMDLITGNAETPVYVYTQVNGSESKQIDKVFTMSDTSYEYYTRSETYKDSYVGADGETLPLLESVQKTLYSFDTVTEQSGYLRIDGATLYLGSAFGEKPQRMTKNNDAIYSVRDGVYTFALAEDEVLYTKTGPADTDFTPVTLPSSEKIVSVKTIAAPYKYVPLYAQQGDQYVLATALDTDGSYLVDTENGGFVLSEEFVSSPLFYLDYTDSEAMTLQQAQEAAATQPVFVKTNGIGDLPLVYGMNALSSTLNMDELTLDDIGVYFGIDLSNEMLESVKYVPFAYLSDSMNAEMNNVYVADLLTLDANSSQILLFLAYGEEGVDYTVNDDGSIEAINKKTVGQLTSSLDEIKISSVVKIDEKSHKLMQAIKDWTLNDFSDSAKIDSLTLSDVLTIVADEDATDENPASPKILQALADVSLEEIGEAINTLALNDILAIDESDSLLANLKNSTLETLAEDIRNMTVQMMFADSIYDKFAVGTLRTDTAEQDYAALCEIYGQDNLYVFQKGSYEKYTYSDVSKDTVLYSSYLLLNKNNESADPAENLENYTSVPLFFRSDDGTYKLATEILSWKLPKTDSSAKYYLDKDGKEIADANADGSYGQSYLYFWDPVKEDMVKVSLSPASYGVKEEFAAENLYTKLFYQPLKTDEEGQQYYNYGNAFVFSIEKDSWIHVPLLAASDTEKGALYVDENGKTSYFDNDAYVYKYLSDDSAVPEDVKLTVKYIVDTENLPETLDLSEATLYSYGSVSGVWKYLITDETGAEQRCSVQSIDQLIPNVTRNINTLTLQELYDDGMVEITDISLLDMAIPYDKVPALSGKFGSKSSVGQLTLNELLNLTLQIISFVNELPFGS